MRTSDDGSGTGRMLTRGPSSKPPCWKANSRSPELNSASPFQSPVSHFELPTAASSYCPAWNSSTKSLVLNSPSKFESPM
ncbi:MAG: hypothetical protein ACK559_06655 [bacterium]